MGTLAEPLGPSPALLFEPRSEAIIDLVGDDLFLTDTDIAGLAAGANRMLVGGELLQFLQARPLGQGRWRLSGLLRGRQAPSPLLSWATWPLHRLCWLTTPSYHSIR